MTYCLTCHSQDTCTFEMLPEHDVVPVGSFIAEWDRLHTDIEAAKIPERIREAFLADMDRTRDKMHSVRDATLRKLGFIP